MFVLDLCLNFHIGFVVTNNFQRRLVMDSRKVVSYYLRMGALIKHVGASWACNDTQKLRCNEEGLNSRFCGLHARV